MCTVLIAETVVSNVFKCSLTNMVSWVSETFFPLEYTKGKTGGLFVTNISWYTSLTHAAAPLFAQHL